ncbi:hypothetical protein [Corynebacterium aquatimens]|uniref:Secreted protein n=1 Tax=Corynebacterium aquatimens TaxID=1190508 RepID=A0A931GXT5_9CORY|nr:hypothetical protein [Corynebacterium aquatimens]MBG6122414.1 hypothetical protein [Corynebacterium aquatimens]WJY65046.1 hypothetical protein CAQUA_01540 [Corynebacterium aquatimens]
MKSKKLAAAALKMTLATTLAATLTTGMIGANSAQAFEVTPMPFAGCRIAATEGDLAAMRAYDEAYLNALQRLLKERIPGVAADVDTVADHARATRDLSPFAPNPEHIGQAMWRIDQAALKVGYDRYDHPGPALLGAIRNTDQFNRDRLEVHTGAFNRIKATEEADKAARGDNPSLFYQADLSRFTTNRSAAYTKLQQDAHAAAKPQMDAFKKRAADGFAACRDGRPLNDGTAALQNSKNIKPGEETATELFDRAAEAFSKGDLGGALNFLFRGVMRGLQEFLMPIMMLPAVPAWLSSQNQPR